MFGTSPLYSRTALLIVKVLNEIDLVYTECHLLKSQPLLHFILGFAVVGLSLRNMLLPDNIILVSILFCPPLFPSVLKLFALKEWQ